MSDPGWAIQADPPVLLPGRSVAFSLTYAPDRDLDARSVRAVLRCRERYRYSRTEGTGTSARRVTKTRVEELAQIEVQLAGSQRLVKGQPITWHCSFDVPGLGPATFEGDALRCDWTLEANIDLPMGLDPRLEETVHVAQPVALLRAGVVDTGQYGLFETAPVNLDGSRLRSGWSRSRSPSSRRSRVRSRSRWQARAMSRRCASSCGSSPMSRCPAVTMTNASPGAGCSNPAPGPSAVH